MRSLGHCQGRTTSTSGWVMQRVPPPPPTQHLAHLCVGARLAIALPFCGPQGSVCALIRITPIHRKDPHQRCASLACEVACVLNQRHGLSPSSQALPFRGDSGLLFELFLLVAFWALCGSTRGSATEAEWASGCWRLVSEAFRTEGSGKLRST